MAIRDSVPRTAILFDLDGTLIDSIGEIALAINDWLTAEGLVPVDEAHVREWIGLGVEHLLKSALAHVGAAESDIDANYDTHFANFEPHYVKRSGTASKPYPGVLDCLFALKEQDYKLGIVTNKIGSATDEVLQAHGFTELFDVVIAGDTIPSKKPEAAPVLLALGKLQVGPAGTLFVGDSMTDVKSAKSAGVETWVFTHGYHHGAFDDISSLSPQPDKVLADFDELTTLLQK